MKKRITLRLLLVAAVPLMLLAVAVAQEGGNAGRDDAVIEKGDDTTAPSGDADREKTVRREEAARRDAETAKKELARKNERNKKKEVKRQTEKKDPEVADRDIDRESTESLLLVDHEKIRYNRIPGITLPADEAAEEPIVRVPEDRKAGDGEKDDGKGGIFGKNTGAIAGWGLLVVIFIIFVIYSKTRGRGSRRRVVRTMPKR